LEKDHKGTKNTKNFSALCAFVVYSSAIGWPKGHAADNFDVNYSKNRDEANCLIAAADPV